MVKSQAAQVNNSLDQLIDSYNKYIHENPTPFETSEQRVEKDLLELKQFFRMNSLHSHLSRAIPAIITRCRSHLPPLEWESMETELRAAETNLHRSRRSAEIFKNLREALCFAEDTIRGFEWAGKEYYFEENYYVAASIYAFLTVLDPLEESYWLRCGISHLENKSYTEALACFTGASYINPDNPLSNLFAAECYRKIFDLGSARGELEQGKSILKRTNNSDPDLIEIIDYLEKKLSYHR